MKNIFFWVTACAVVLVPCGKILATPAGANSAVGGPPVLGDVATSWPGVHFQVTLLKRIPPDRLLVVVRIVATSATPLPGVKIEGPRAAPPPNTPAKYVDQLTPIKPFSLDPTTMTDDLAQQQLSTLPPVAPPGRAYRSSSIIAFLRPGDDVLLTLQFSLPPPPPPSAPGQPPPKQTLSFVFPKATGPMNHVVLPPPPLPPVGGAKP